MATSIAAQASVRASACPPRTGSSSSADGRQRNARCAHLCAARPAAQYNLAQWPAEFSRAACARAGAGERPRLPAISTLVVSRRAISVVGRSSVRSGFAVGCPGDRGFVGSAQPRSSSYCALSSGRVRSGLQDPRKSAPKRHVDNAPRPLEAWESMASGRVTGSKSMKSGTRGRGGPSSRTMSKKRKVDVVDEEAAGRSITQSLLPREEGESSNGMTWGDWKFIILPFLFPALGGLLFGYDIGATSDAILSLKSATLSGVSWHNLDSLQTGLVVSGSLGGALLGSALAYVIADPIGRRMELILSASLYLLGSLVQGAAPDLIVLVMGRLIYGIAIGLAMHGAPMYIAETAPASVRGTLVSLKEGFIVLGVLAGYFVGNETIELLGGWRWMFGAAAPVAVVMGVGMAFLPRSPRWLLLRALRDPTWSNSPQSGARAALCALRGNKSGRGIDDEMANMLASIETPGESGDTASWAELVQGTNRKALIIGTGLVFFQQVTGQPSVLYYAASVLKSAGFEAAADATQAAVIIGVFKLLMTGIAIGTVDKVGRKPLLLVGVSGIVVSLFLLYFFLEGGSADVSVIALLLYVGCYQISFGPVSWLMVSEVFPLRVRGRALSIATLVNFGSNAVVTFGLPPLQDRIGTGNAFLAFGIIGVLALAFILFRVPETKGLSLEEIEMKLRDS